MANIKGVFDSDSFSSSNQNILLSTHFNRLQHPIQPIRIELDKNQSSILLQQPQSISSQKQSAENLDELNSKQEFNTQNVVELKQALLNQNKFMNQIGNHKNSIIQEEILSHISGKSAKYEKINFLMIQSYTKERIGKMEKNKRFKKNWSQKDLKILVWIVAKYCQFHKIKDPYYGIVHLDVIQNPDQWEQISALIPGTTSQVCMFKWLGLKKSKIRDQKWQKEQEDLLYKIVEEYSDQQPWNEIAKRLFYQSYDKNRVYRCGKQCRQHWNCFLNPKIKRGNWTKEQDRKLIQLVLQQNLQKRWAKLVSEFDGRTENALKNRYAIIVDKQTKNFHYSKKITEKTILENYLKTNNIEEIIQQKLQPIDLEQENNEGSVLMEQNVKKSQQQTKNEFQKLITQTKILDDQAEFLISRIQAQKQIHHIKSNTQLCSIMGRKIV